MYTTNVYAVQVSLPVMPNLWQVLVGLALATLLPAVGETGDKARDKDRDKARDKDRDKARDKARGKDRDRASRSYRKQYI